MCDDCVSREEFERLAEQVEDLEEEKEQLRDENEQLRERVDELEEQPEVELRSDDPDAPEPYDIWIGGLPLGKGLKNRKESVKELKDHVFEIDDRVHDIEVGEVDPGQIVAESPGPAIEDLLPIHQNYLTTKHVDPGQHGLSENQEIAARIFPHFADAADPTGGTMTLKSGKVRDIIEREIATPELAKRLDVRNPNQNTVRRAMDFLGKFGGDLIEFKTDQKVNRLEADYDDWVEYEHGVMEQASSGDQSGTSAEVATDGGQPEGQ